MFILLLSLLSLLLKDVGEEFNSPIANPQVIEHHYFHKKTKLNLNAGRCPEQINSERSINYG